MDRSEILITDATILQNRRIHRYIIPMAHACLWIAALSMAGFIHTCKLYSASTVLLLCTWCAYIAYLCESGLVRWRVAAALTFHDLDFRGSSMCRYVWISFLLQVLFTVIFVYTSSDVWILPVIGVAGWQKYIDGRSAVRLAATKILNPSLAHLYHPEEP